MKNILIISNNPLSVVQNNGKTLLSLLGHNKNVSLRQVFFRDDTPDYNNCKYYKITDQQILRSVLPWNPSAGCEVFAPQTITSSVKKNSEIQQTSTNSHLKRLIRDLIWKLGHIDFKRFNQWIDETGVDGVFFMGGDCVFAYELVLKIIDRLQCPLILYITDDYLIKRYYSSIFFEIRRKLLLRAIKKIKQKVRLLITISEAMSETYDKIFDTKSIYYANIPEWTGLDSNKITQKNHKEFIITYAGGLHYNRWKILAALGKAIQYHNKKINIPVSLRIYSIHKPDEEICKSISIPGSSYFMGAASSDEIKVIQNNSDWLVHVESFEKDVIEATRFSFSTKIFEYMATGKPILAIGPSSIASIDYLADCSLCVTDPGKITSDLIDKITDDKIICNMSQKSLKKINDIQVNNALKESVIKRILDVI
jgi:glycosyltransferase involved in cell wall biosynthesis